MNHGIYGQYNVEVIKSGSSESYYPFGTGYQKNLILDDFLNKILNGWKHSPLAWMQTCITNTGTGMPTRFDTTGTFQYVNGQPFNDRTWASSVFLTGFVPSENRMWMFRDFIFDTVIGSSRTYREAMVGLFYKSSSTNFVGGYNNTLIESDIALSHFVFPQDVIVQPGDRLKINYTVNFIIDYLSQTGIPITLNGGGYNFDGVIYTRISDQGMFGVVSDPHSFFTYDSATLNMIYRPYNTNSNSYGISSTNTVYNSKFSLFGTPTSYNHIGFWGQNFTTGVFPQSYGGASISGAAATLNRQNFQIDDAGASVDMAYYFSPSASSRGSISGILLTKFNEAQESTHNRGMIYLLFNNRPQTIPANESISMKLKWNVRRL